ncbi:MAG: hypothetical protein DRO52_00505 [Candidatus Hecatellales archaeon]|nr:MAG: hypothetical protein DRO52_00505 [Candidatus Hecatellales archaeon]
MEEALMLGENRREIVEKVRDFHGHFGPYAALGVRLGWLGLERLKVERGDERLRIRLTLNVLKPPTTCIIDGIQVSTGCTIGNGRLKVARGKAITASFAFNGKRLRLKASKAFIRWFRDRLDRGEPMERVAYDVLKADVAEILA